ncbi:MAG: nucleoside hydrolase-like domain-containing protein, partial [Planctomycetota bacterium]
MRFGLGLLAAFLAAAPPVVSAAELPRLIVLADMGNEADEEQQIVHLLVNSNEFELEGLIAVTGKYLNENAKNAYRQRLHPELFHRLIDGYAQVEANLRLHADNWPTADRLRGIVRTGQEKYGLADVG